MICCFRISMPDTAPPSKPESLDEIVSHSATALAEQIQAAAAWAKSEMDLQIEVAAALKAFARRAQIKLEGHHNITVATGRPDSVYGSVIVEYKEPHYLSPNKDAAPNKALIEQLKKRFYDFRREENRSWNSMFGVGTDGTYFIFLRFRDEKWTDQEPLPVDRYSTQRFLWALYNLGQKGKPYQPEYLHGDFGSESPVAQEGVRALYEEILGTTNPKAQVFFSQWKILFGEVCGYDVENPSEKLKKLADFYEVTGKAQPAQLLFAVHTYYGILIKLLAAEIVSFFNPWMSRQVERLLNATTSTKLKRELEELELRGGIFHQMGITNFLEGDLFSWYLGVWSDPIERLTRRIIGKLDEYNPGTFSEDPAQSRDLLKKLYQQLFPKSVRHDLGEYYTPDWLAEHVLNELGYIGDPDKRLLDPACGSGTFLVMAINRIRRWYEANREKCAYDEGDLLRKILTNVVGFDLNPLAVMAARTNYLVAIKDLVRYVDGVEIPVYLCDSIMTPAEYGDLFTGAHGAVAKVPCSAVKPPHLLVPQEIAKTPQDVAKYAQILETSVTNAYGPDEFLGRCRDEGLRITATRAHIDLYKELVRLDRENKNGIWARIIKNNFAPLFVGKVDYVAGNPPWIAWNNLPQDYREQTKPVWKEYGFFTQKGYRALVPAGPLEFSALFVFVCADVFLSAGGRLGFVITQTIFQSKGAGDGFRKFRLPNGDWIRPDVVHDMSRLKPFDATNRTAVLTLTRGEQPRYPVPYYVWSPTSTSDVQEARPEDIPGLIRRETCFASPVNPAVASSPWRVGQGPKAGAGRRFRTEPSQYLARSGVHTHGANAIFWLRHVKALTPSVSLYQNVIERAKKKVEAKTAPLEDALVFPLLRGRDTQRWLATPELSILLTHSPSSNKNPIPLDEMQRKYPKAYQYLHSFEQHLKDRSMMDQLSGSGPFYRLFKIGPYTYSAAKVVWREQSSELSAVVITSFADKVVIPDHKLYCVACRSQREAHFICALLNSKSAVSIAGETALPTSQTAHILELLPIPKFNPDDPHHARLASFSVACHTSAQEGDARSVAGIQREIDDFADRVLLVPNTRDRR